MDGDADRVAGMLLDALAWVGRRDAPAGPPGVNNYVGFKVAKGQQRVETAA